MKTWLIKNGTVYTNGEFKELEIYIDERGIVSLAETFDFDADETIDATGCHIIPGLIDPHVHLREPGFEYKETIKTGSEAAAAGGYTTIFAMGNLNPAPDSVENITKEINIIDKDSTIRIIPYARITKANGELVDFKALKQYTSFFSDDGSGVQQEETMSLAMSRVKEINGVIVAHCEDEAELNGGYVHDGEFAKEHHHLGINSASEYKQVARDLKLAYQTGCQYHICHISTKESVDYLRKYKIMGANVSGEVTPHHLLLSENDIDKDDGCYKMNPPLRSLEDKQELIKAIQEGTIEIIATDHAPHSAQEKSQGLKDSSMGIVGLETAFGLLYTNLVKEKLLTLNQLIDCMSYNVANVMGIDGGDIESGYQANLTIVDLNKREKINSKSFKSKGKSTPFDGWYVYGMPIITFANGKLVYRR